MNVPVIEWYRGRTSQALVRYLDTWDPWTSFCVHGVTSRARCRSCRAHIFLPVRLPSISRHRVRRKHVFLPPPVKTNDEKNNWPPCLRRFQIMFTAGKQSLTVELVERLNPELVVRVEGRTSGGSYRWSVLRRSVQETSCAEEHRTT